MSTREKQRKSPASADRRPAASNPLPFLTAAVLCVTALAGVYGFFVHTAVGQLLDEAALREAELHQTRISAGLQEFLDLLPLLSVVIAAAVILFVTMVQRRWAAAILATVAMFGANLTTQVLKEVLERPELGVQTLATNSLPSGHTTLAASSAATVLLVVSPRWRPLAAAAGGSYAVICGAATLINLWHRPSDVIAAYLVVGVWTAIAGWIILRAGTAWNVWDGFGDHWTGSQFWPFACLALSLCAGMAAVLLVVVSGPSITTPASADRLPLIYAAGLAMIASAGYLLTALATWMLGRAARLRH